MVYKKRADESELHLGQGYNEFTLEAGTQMLHEFEPEVVLSKHEMKMELLVVSSQEELKEITGGSFKLSPPYAVSASLSARETQSRREKFTYLVFFCRKILVVETIREGLCHPLYDLFSSSEKEAQNKDSQLLYSRGGTGFVSAISRGTALFVYARLLDMSREETHSLKGKIKAEVSSLVDAKLGLEYFLSMLKSLIVAEINAHEIGNDPEFRRVIDKVKNVAHTITRAEGPSQTEEPPPSDDYGTLSVTTSSYTNLYSCGVFDEKVRQIRLLFERFNELTKQIHVAIESAQAFALSNPHRFQDDVHEKHCQTLIGGLTNYTDEMKRIRDEICNTTNLVEIRLEKYLSFAEFSPERKEVERILADLAYWSKATLVGKAPFTSGTCIQLNCGRIRTRKTPYRSITLPAGTEYLNIVLIGEKAEEGGYLYPDIPIHLRVKMRMRHDIEKDIFGDLAREIDGRKEVLIGVDSLRPYFQGDILKNVYLGYSRKHRKEKISDTNKYDIQFYAVDHEHSFWYRPAEKEDMVVQELSQTSSLASPQRRVLPPRVSYEAGFFSTMMRSQAQGQKPPPDTAQSSAMASAEDERRAAKSSSSNV
ncbi:MAG: hypothetical protein ACD_44C00366G0011 [uncultured bacterium]|nr:MAG: hypothetical protein ACD_44C00366G0011 [uncultured bacterium]OGT24110.1 MAG: hypothetical protein A2W47_01030 [Gammaproteobacteria bacterium RIFCSPHIGHO2_12_38_15]